VSVSIPSTPRPRTSAVPRPMVLLAWVIPLGVLVQAVLAGQGWFVDPGLFALHGGIGHGVLLVSALVATFAWLLPTSRSIAVLASLTALGLIGQTGLGYAGRRAELAAASAAHVPLGVALLGLAVAAAVLCTVQARVAVETGHADASR
jgi:hypothetical protein